MNPPDLPQDPDNKNSPLDFSKKHPIFNIELHKQGPQFSQIDDLREQYIQKYAGKVTIPQPYVPLNIVGLIPRKGPLPSNRRFWSRSTTSFQRNGIFNIHTPNLNTRLIYPVFFIMVFYGWYGHQTAGWFQTRYRDNYEMPGNVYDKLNFRVPPASKIWLRPG